MDKQTGLYYLDFLYVDWTGMVDGSNWKPMSPEELKKEVRKGYSHLIRISGFGLLEPEDTNLVSLYRDSNKLRVPNIILDPKIIRDYLIKSEKTLLSLITLLYFELPEDERDELIRRIVIAFEDNITKVYWVISKTNIISPGYTENYFREFYYGYMEYDISPKERILRQVGKKFYKKVNKKIRKENRFTGKDDRKKLEKMIHELMDNNKNFPYQLDESNVLSEKYGDVGRTLYKIISLGGTELDSNGRLRKKPGDDTLPWDLMIPIIIDEIDFSKLINWVSYETYEWVNSQLLPNIFHDDLREEDIRHASIILNRLSGRKEELMKLEENERVDEFLSNLPRYWKIMKDNVKDIPTYIQKTVMTTIKNTE